MLTVFPNFVTWLGITICQIPGWLLDFGDFSIYLFVTFAVRFVVYYSHCGRPVDVLMVFHCTSVPMAWAQGAGPWQILVWIQRLVHNSTANTSHARNKECKKITKLLLQSNSYMNSSLVGRGSTAPQEKLFHMKQQMSLEYVYCCTFYMCLLIFKSIKLHSTMHISVCTCTKYTVQLW